MISSTCEIEKKQTKETKMNLHIQRMGQWLPVAAEGWTKWVKGVYCMMDGN